MANIIKPKRSNTAAKVPTTTELVSGELGVNMADRKVYINNGTAVVQVGAGNLSGLGDVAITTPSNGQALKYNSTTTKWENSSAGVGDVVGPASATDNALVRFDGATGKLIQNSTATLDDTGNMDTASLKADFFDLDTAAAAPASAVGREAWDDGAGAPIVGLKGGVVTYYYGQQEFARVYNGSGTAMTKGQVVYIVGAQGNRVDVRLAQANAESTSANTIGFVAEPIAAGAEGWVQTTGPLPKLNTSTLTAGQTVYLSPTTAGAYTTTKPTAPSHLVVLGFVERVDTTVGSIFLKIDNGYELDELHNVNISSPTGGQLLAYDQTAGYWKNIALTDGTGISVTETAGGAITVTNTAPDQTVVLTQGGATTITGTYPNFTISSVNTTYNLATSTIAGLIELGSNTQQTVAANAVSATASRTYALQVNAAGQGVVNVPWTDTNSGGTVTSVAVSGGTTGLTTSGGPITTSGTITLAGTLAVANGGTGATTLTGLVKGNGTAAFTAATAGTDYVIPSGSITGNAATATTLQTARTINGVSFNGSANITVEPYIEDDEGTNATRYLVFTDDSTAGYKRLNEDSSLNYNPSTNTLTVGTVSGALSGNATSATTAYVTKTNANGNYALTFTDYGTADGNKSIRSTANDGDVSLFTNPSEAVIVSERAFTGDTYGLKVRNRSAYGAGINFTSNFAGVTPVNSYIIADSSNFNFRSDGGAQKFGRSTGNSSLWLRDYNTDAVLMVSNDGTTIDLRAVTQANNAWRWMRIQEAGQLIVGGGSPDGSSKITVGGRIYGASPRDEMGYYINCPGTSIGRVLRAPGYLEWTTDVGAIGTSYFLSDQRLKKNIAPTQTAARDAIDAIEFKQFDWNEYTDQDGVHVELGLVAQQLQQVNPKFVNVMSDSTLGVNDTELLTYALKTIQELSAELKLVKQELAQLKGVA